MTEKNNCHLDTVLKMLKRFDRSTLESNDWLVIWNSFKNLDPTIYLSDTWKFNDGIIEHSAKVMLWDKVFFQSDCIDTDLEAARTCCLKELIEKISDLTSENNEELVQGIEWVTHDN